MLRFGSLYQTYLMLIWFIHVPRTGGMSLAKYLHLIKSNTIKIKHDGHAKFSKPVLAALKAKHKKVVTCTILRDPVSHSMSLWSYLKKHKKHYGHLNANNSNFAHWCHTFKEFPYYVKFFGEGNLDKALKVIKNIDFILQTKNLTQDTNQMLKKLNLKANFNISINSTSKRKPSLKEAKLIRQIRQDDYTLLKLL